MKEGENGTLRSLVNVLPLVQSTLPPSLKNKRLLEDEEKKNDKRRKRRRTRKQKVRRKKGKQVWIPVGNFVSVLKL